MTVVTKKFQITIPKKVREDLGIKEGDQIAFLKTKDGYRIVKVDDLIDEAAEIFKDVEETVEEMRDSFGRNFD